MFRHNQMIRIIIPGHPTAHGAIGTIERLTVWGAHVKTKATATGRLRVLYREMHPIIEVRRNAG